MTVDGLALRNAGWKWQALNPNKPMTEEQAIRCARACCLPCAQPEQYCSPARLTWFVPVWRLPRYRPLVYDVELV